MNKKMTTPNAAAPTGRWRTLAARCLDTAARGEVCPPRGATRCSSCSSPASWPTGPGSPGTLLARFDLVNLIRDLNEEDAFYYFQIARNLAEGKFSTFDGGITRTNDTTPLWLLLVTPFHWVFDKEAALFAIKAFEIMLVAGGVALVTAAARLGAPALGSDVRRAADALPAARAAYGDGSGGGAVHAGPVHSDRLPLRAQPARWKWPLAATAFALPWVRPGGMSAISLAATAALCLIEWSRPESPSSRQGRGRVSAPRTGGWPIPCSR